MFTSIFCVPPPPNSRPLKTNSATSTMITKITSTATTPVLPPPPPSSSAMTESSCWFSFTQGAKQGKGPPFWGDPIVLGIDRVSTALSTNSTGRFDVAGLNRWRRSGSRGAAGHDPKFYTVVFTETAVHHHETRSIDTALFDQVVARACHQAFDLSDRTVASAVGDDVTSRRLIVLE